MGLGFRVYRVQGLEPRSIDHPQTQQPSRASRGIACFRGSRYNMPVCLQSPHELAIATTQLMELRDWESAYTASADPESLQACCPNYIVARITIAVTKVSVVLLVLLVGLQFLLVVPLQLVTNASTTSSGRGHQQHWTSAGPYESWITSQNLSPKPHSSALNA